MSARLDLSLITDRLAPLVAGGAVAQIATTTGSQAALSRGRVTATAIYVYRLAIDVDWAGISRREQTETIGVLTVHRATATAPDVGAGASAIVQAITEGATGLLAPIDGWRPTDSTRAIAWEGGNLLLATDQITAWEDRYSITLIL